jgi:beta-mannanase
MPLVSWEPWKFGGGIQQPDYALRKIIGTVKHDAYIRRWARAAAAWGKPFFLRFAHEMNGDWTSWSPGVNGNTTREFVSAWRKVHGIFRQEGATNVRWVWAPVAHSEEHTPYRYVYPGDAYVNWFGISGYNWGNTREWSRWQSFSEIFRKSYKTMADMARKPIMIPEMACAESGGDKSAWIRSAFLKEIPGTFPRIKVVAWFNADKENDWRVNSSSEALSAYKEVARNPIYQRSFL